MNKIIVFVLAIMFVILIFGFQPKTQFDSYKSKNFLIKYERSISNPAVKSIASDLELQFKEWTKRLNLTPNKLPVEVRIYKTEKKYIQESQSTLKEEGTYSNGIIFLPAPSKLDEKGMRVNIVSRVVALSILSAANDNGCPRWLSEAYGIYAGGDLEKYGTPTILRAISFLDFQQEINQAKREKDLVYLYSKLSQVMKFLVDRYGKQKVDSIFIGFDGIKTVEQVFEETLSEKYDKIEMAWNEAVKNRKSKR